MAMFSQTTIILGNGFDLDLGLNTSYKSFIDSKDFEFWMKEYIDTPDETNLFDYIFKQRLIDTWGGVEASIYDFAEYTKAIDRFDYEMIEQEFRHLEDAIAEFLKKVDYNNIIFTSCAWHLLGILRKFPHVNIFSFNYTDIAKLPGTPLPNSRIKHIHGTLTEKNAILGIQDCKIRQELSFFKKSHHTNYMSKKFIESLNKSERILFYGHSMCLSDMDYFTSLFKNICRRESNIKSIDFVVLDSDAEKELYKNIDFLSEHTLAEIRECVDLFVFKTKDNSRAVFEMMNKFDISMSEPAFCACMPTGRRVNH